VSKRDTAAQARRRIEGLGVPAHLYHVREAPSCVLVTVISGNARIVRNLRSTITQREIDLEMKRIENFVAMNSTIDLEEAIANADRKKEIV
jgi:hypothetical protein